MADQMIPRSSINAEELHDNVTIYKISNDPIVSENIKSIGIPEVFSSLKKFCTIELKVFIFYLSSTETNFIFLKKYFIS